MHTRDPPSFDVEQRRRQQKEHEEHPPLLEGAEEVLAFVRNNVFPVAYQVLTVTHAAQWVIHYTVAFLRTMIAQNEKEARVRVDLLARCVRLLGGTESFSALLLSLESKTEEYDSFWILRETAELHLTSLLDDIERGLTAVLACRFPLRRARLFMMERGVRVKLQRALLFINEMDYNWSPNVAFHAEWKQIFLSGIFKRIHTVVEPLFAFCSLGFIDSCLYDSVTDGRLFSQRAPSGKSPTFPRARSLAYDCTIERLSFLQIGMGVKGVASLVVGLQLCMGARYVLKQCSPAYDEQWGFHMDEDVEGTTADDAIKAVDYLTKSVKQKALPHTSSARAPRSTVFLTQADGEI
ncbi:hypothetical protein STCU_09358 [Strigomonas culicis]|nr:hypothetical protein STCU_09358 [Strigomonas culicis]|eukprot:EPY19630.1 hypothetical protein STCU_09358 [Strigomonas culicis]